MEHLTSDNTVEVQDDSIVELFPLVVNEERNRYGEYYVGGVASGDFVGLAEEGVQALRLLQQGLTVNQVSQCLKGDDGYGVDVRAFVQDLWKLGFVRSVDGRSADSRVAQSPGDGSLGSPLNRWPFLLPVLVLCVAVAMAGVAVMITNRRYLPRWQDFFWHESYSLILVVGLIVNWLRLAGHELAHLGAARALGVKGQFTLSTRLWFVVGQTRFRDLWRLPKRERCLVYLAGMLHDVVAVASLTLYLWIYDHFNPYGGEVLYRFAKALILGFTLGLVWQFNFYMRTDIYQFLADFADCTNLFNDAKAYLFCKVSFWNKQSVLENLALGEKRVVRLYSLILAGGTLMALLVFALYQVPAIMAVLENATTNLFSHPVTQWQQAQWDSLAVFVLISSNLILLAGLLMRRIWAKPAEVQSALSHQVR
jgi:hypothetical protein